MCSRGPERSAVEVTAHVFSDLEQLLEEGQGPGLELEPDSSALWPSVSCFI